MNIADANGVTRREHYKQVGARRELDPPVAFPEVLAAVWDAFIELHDSRSAGGMGPSPISYSDMAAWARLHGVSLRPWEVRAIKRLDAAWMKVQAEAMKT